MDPDLLREKIARERHALNQDDPMIGTPLRELLRQHAGPDMNAGAYPERYAPEGAIYYGQPRQRFPGGMIMGEVPRADPTKVMLMDPWDYKTGAHEGTHSLIHTNQQEQHNLQPHTRELVQQTLEHEKNLDARFQQVLRDLMDVDDGFLQQYTDLMRHQIPDDKYISYAVEPAEIMARLQAMEAIQPKDQFIDQSEWAPWLFHDEDMYNSYQNMLK